MASEKREQSIGQAQEQALLHGGLRGRMAGAFCTLQSSVDALQRYLLTSTTPEVYETARAMLEEMDRRLAMLQRISGNAADLACGVLTRGAEELAPLELTDYLSEIAACVNEELTLRGFTAHLTVRWKDGPFWAMATTGLVDGIVVNLISNFLQVCPGGNIRLTLGPDRILRYADDGPGMDASAAATLLERGEAPISLQKKGSLGLLLVREYALAMNWSVQVEPAEQGLAIRFVLPEFEMPAARSSLWDAAAETRSRTSLFVARLTRELDGVFGLPRPVPRNIKK